MGQGVLEKSLPCNTLSSKVRIHQCLKYCFPLRFPLHLRSTILEQAKCTLPFIPLGLQGVQRN